MCLGRVPRCPEGGLRPGPREGGSERLVGCCSAEPTSQLGVTSAGSLPRGCAPWVPSSHQSPAPTRGVQGGLLRQAGGTPRTGPAAVRGFGAGFLGLRSHWLWLAVKYIGSACVPVSRGASLVCFCRPGTFRKKGVLQLTGEQPALLRPSCSPRPGAPQEARFASSPKPSEAAGSNQTPPGPYMRPAGQLWGGPAGCWLPGQVVYWGVSPGVQGAPSP